MKPTDRNLSLEILFFHNEHIAVLTLSTYKQKLRKNGKFDQNMPFTYYIYSNLQRKDQEKPVIKE